MSSPQAGVNLVGFFEGEEGQGRSVRLGLGEIPRRLGRALEHAGVPYAPIAYRASGAQASATQLRAQAVYDANIVCVNADYLGQFLRDAGTDFFAERFSIGVWFWETSRFRLDPGTPLACLDEIWVASSYVREAVAAAVDVPLHVAPLPMELPAPPAQSRVDLGLPDGYLFLFAFNAVSAARKNPTAVLEAFTQAFSPGEGPVLVLKSVNGRERKPRLFAELETAARGRPDVVVIDRYLDPEDSHALIASCDCYVSLHRSEGLGLTLAEAMAYGKPVIATGYSGNLDFMDERTAYLVPYGLVPVPGDWWASMPGAEWADPDVGAAAALMRQVYGDQDEARARGARGRGELLRRYSLDAAARFVAGRLADGAARTAHATPGSRQARTAILEASLELSKGIGGSMTTSPVRGPKGVFRRLLLRALWPHLVDQQRLNAALVDAVDELRRSEDDLRRDLAGLAQAAPDETSRGVTLHDRDHRGDAVEREAGLRRRSHPTDRP